MVFKFAAGGIQVIGDNASSDVTYTPVFPESMARDPKKIDMDIPMVKAENPSEPERPFIIPRSELPVIGSNSDDDQDGEQGDEDVIKSGSWDDNVKSM